LRRIGHVIANQAIKIGKEQIRIEELITAFNRSNEYLLTNH
jgi:hypothetical protein